MNFMAKEKIRPLATSASVVPTSNLDEEGTSRWPSAEYLPKRRCFLFSCGFFIVAVVILGFIALILALTEFKVRDPKLSIIGIHVEGLKAAVGANSSFVNATMTADVLIKNRNAASFRLENSTTTFSYHQEVMGVASVPGGVVPAGQSSRMNVTVPIETLYIATGDIPRSVNLTSFTEIKGRVNLFGIFRRKLSVFLNCDMTLDLSLNKQDAGNLVCGTKTI